MRKKAPPVKSSGHSSPARGPRAQTAARKTSASRDTSQESTESGFPVLEFLSLVFISCMLGRTVKDSAADSDFVPQSNVDLSNRVTVPATRGLTFGTNLSSAEQKTRSGKLVCVLSCGVMVLFLIRVGEGLADALIQLVIDGMSSVFWVISCVSFPCVCLEQRLQIEEAQRRFLEELASDPTLIYCNALAEIPSTKNLSAAGIRSRRESSPAVSRDGLVSGTRWRSSVYASFGLPTYSGRIYPIEKLRMIAR